MTLLEQIYVRVRDLPDDAASEILDFIGYIQLKLERRGSGTTPSHAPGMESFPARSWNAQAFLDRFAGAVPDFPDIEDEGSPQEREWLS